MRLPKVIIDGPAFLGMILSSIEVFEYETYGILIGTKHRKNYVVKYAVPLQTTNRRKYEVSICHKRAAAVRRSIKGISPYHYIGEFHSHPYGAARLSEHDKKDMEQCGELISLLVIVEPAKKHEKWRYDQKDKAFCGSVDDEFLVRVKGYLYDHVKKKIRKVHLKCPYISRLNRLKNKTHR